MSKSANVRSIQALKDFRIAFCNFADDTRGALGGVEMEIKKFRDWIERDQLSYWQMQVKKRQEILMDARAALHKKKLAAGKSDAVSDSEEKENLRIAQRRLRAAEEKVDLVKKLIPQFHHAVAEYHSNAQPLADHMSGGFERSLGRLTAMIDALESYLALQAPEAPRPSATSMSGSSSNGSPRTTSGPTTRTTSEDRAEEAPPATAKSEPEAEDSEALTVGSEASSTISEDRS
jgi:hypothetical protein